MQKTGDIIQATSVLLGVLPMAENKTFTAKIGPRLAQLRKDKGITQAELAEMLGVSQPMMSDYERGELRLHGELILQITKSLKVSADELLGIKVVSGKNGSIKNRRLSRKLKEIDLLPKRDQDALLRTIDAFISKSS